MKPQKYVIRVTHIQSGQFGYLSHFSMFNATTEDFGLATRSHFDLCVVLPCAYRFSRKYLADALCRTMKGSYIGCKVEVIDITKEVEG